MNLVSCQIILNPIIFSCFIIYFYFCFIIYNSINYLDYNFFIFIIFSRFEKKWNSGCFHKQENYIYYLYKLYIYRERIFRLIKNFSGKLKDIQSTIYLYRLSMNQEPENSTKTIRLQLNSMKTIRLEH